ncbi:MAG: hypothetical protein PHU06_12080, partial [Gallionella sp.]|nr:hypothetical protein [Gallionella sp.]MDD4959716.1 hypothetical protein [Gallionella sp.]
LKCHFRLELAREFLRRLSLITCSSFTAGYHLNSLSEIRGPLYCLLPWLVLLPSFGWGVLGRRAPKGSNALLASTLSHIPYGFGVGAVIAAGV